MEKICFETMSDDRVLERVDGLIARSNEITAELLAVRQAALVPALPLRQWLPQQ